MSDLQDRYGTTASSRRVTARLVAGLGALVSVAFLAWLAWAAWFHSTPAVESELIGWEVSGEHGATARVDIAMRDGSVEASCRLRAFAEDHTVVGEQNFSPADAGLPADAEKVSGTVEVAIRTERRATSVDLVGCTTADQPRPR